MFEIAVNFVSLDRLASYQKLGFWLEFELQDSFTVLGRQRDKARRRTTKR